VFFFSPILTICLLVKPKGRHSWIDSIKMDLVRGNRGKGGIDWIVMAQDSEKCRAVVNVVMNIEFHKRLGGSRVVAQPLEQRLAP
jgi:hypothetical protein